MDNFVDFEESLAFKISAIGLGVCNILLFLNHIIIIIKLSKEENRQKIFKESSCIHIFAQLIFSSLCFCLLHRFHLTNSLFLTLSNLIGIILILEWLCIYIFFYHSGKLVFAFIHMLLPISLPIIILVMLLITEEVNKTIEVVLINIAFIFYLIMFISTGLNTIKLFKTGNPKYISLPNSFIGIFVNIFMAFFIIMLSIFSIMSVIFIIYPIISLTICCFQVVFYFMKKGKHDNPEDLIEREEDKDPNQKEEQTGLMKNDIIEE